MKKIIFVLALIVLVTSCTVIEPNYTGKRIVIEPRDDYGYSPTYGYYDYDYGSLYSPYMWSGWYGLWNPFWLYGYYNYYGPYNPYFWGWYSSGSRSGGYTGKTVITKRQLSKGTTRTLSNGRIIKGSSRTVRSGSTRSTVSRSGSGRSTSSGTRSTVSRSGSSRSTSSRSSSSSSSKKTGTRVKK
ncbi:hypothetical protein ACFLRX_09325 [Acidobacteriota bacterium]